MWQICNTFTYYNFQRFKKKIHAVQAFRTANAYHILNIAALIRIVYDIEVITLTFII